MQDLKYGMTLGELITYCGMSAKERGWHDRPVPISETLENSHSELSEAWQEVRKGKAIHEIYYSDHHDNHADGNRPLMKPEGVPVEIADAIIWLLDFAWRENVNIEKAMIEKLAYNNTRPYRHGNKVA